MATIYVEGKPYQIADGQNLLNACLSLGFNLPYFCWHPAMHSVGACRQCAVKQFKDENDTRGRIVMACMTPALDGTRISIEDPEAKSFRASVIEWLMTNHPHDCPVCDEGGECHLQDMTVMTGHNYRRYRFPKRTFRNQYLGPFVNHEMNRCIQCYRCVRFYRDYAGGRDFDAFAAHNNVYFGRAEDGVLESEFSGNLVEVCPTGVFTDKTLKQHYTRKWDLQTAPSICAHCGLGCNTIPGERYGTLRRIRNRFNEEINGYFLCDRGRYGYEFVNAERRLRWPQRAGTEEAGSSVRLSREDALAYLGELLSEGRGAAGIGSPRASLEANFALRTLVGPENFYLGLSRRDVGLVNTVIRVLRDGPTPSASLADARRADAVFVLGEDVINVAPMLALALRQAARQQPLKKAQKLRIPYWEDGATRRVIQDENGPFFVATASATKLDELATASYYAAPDDLARLGFAVARAVSGEGKAVGHLPNDGEALAERIARALKGAELPLVVAGIGLGNAAIVQAAANVAWALTAAGKPARIALLVPECNTVGLGLIGGRSFEETAEALKKGTADTVIVLENDLFRRGSAGSVEALLGDVENLVVIDHLLNETSGRATVALPAATFAEGDGTWVNNEGRAQRFFQVFVPTGQIQESWRWLRDIGIASGRAGFARWQSLDDVIAAMVAELPELAAARAAAPPATLRLAGQKIPRQPQRYSGRTAMYANVDVSEPKPPDDPDSPLAFSMEGYAGQPPASLIPRFWAPAWNSIQALNKFQQEVGGPLRGDHPGQRIFAPSADAKGAPFADVPKAFSPHKDQWLMVPLYHIYGSEELSVLTPGVAERMPEPYLGLSEEALRQSGLAEGQKIHVSLGGKEHHLVIRAVPGLPHGVIGLPVGLPGLEGIELPVLVKPPHLG